MSKAAKPTPAKAAKAIKKAGGKPLTAKATKIKNSPELRRIGSRQQIGRKLTQNRITTAKLSPGRYNIRYRPSKSPKLSSLKPKVAKASSAIKQLSKKSAPAINKVSKAAGKVGALAAPGTRERYGAEIRRIGSRDRRRRINTRNTTATRIIRPGSYVVRDRLRPSSGGLPKSPSARKLLNKAKKTFSNPGKPIAKAVKSPKKALSKKIKAASKAKVQFPKNVKGPKATCPLLKQKVAPLSASNKLKVKVPKPSPNVVGAIIGGMVGGSTGAVIGALGGKATSDLAVNMGRIVARRGVNVVNESAKVAKDFAAGVKDAGEIAKDGKTDQAVGKLLETVTKGVVQSAAVPIIETVAVVRDVAWAAITAASGRNLSQQEKDFVHKIFGDKIDLSTVRITVIKGARASVAGNSIILGEEPLESPESRLTFAHEMTHIYQDQNPRELGTRGATREMICSYCSWSHISVKDFKAGKTPENQAETQYKVKLDKNSNWSDLGVEQQAMVVQKWQTWRDGYLPEDGFEDSIPDVTRVLKQAGLFPNDSEIQAAPSSKYRGNAW
jgi:hypothetical protein